MSEDMLPTHEACPALDEKVNKRQVLDVADRRRHVAKSHHAGQTRSCFTAPSASPDSASHTGWTICLLQGATAAREPA